MDSLFADTLFADVANITTTFGERSLTPLTPAPHINTPLAEHLRPRQLAEVAGQEHLLGEGKPLHRLLQAAHHSTEQVARSTMPSLMLWGPPGTGKTTLALLLAAQMGAYTVRLSAVEAGVKEVRQVLAEAETRRKRGHRTVLFLDEIHRFNKAQQDALLHAVERGVITLIGATTENPSFEVNAALLSRCQVYRLQALTDEHLTAVAERALAALSTQYGVPIRCPDLPILLRLCGGDARTMLNALELAVTLAPKSADSPSSPASPPSPPELPTIVLTAELLETAVQQKTPQYDKQGEGHYDTISAFIKSLRGSDPDAAMFWLAKMLEAGEDARFIARRMLIFASEDVGNADPQALLVALTVFQAVDVIGLPEARINLAQGVAYLASCAKSNASYRAIEQALADVRGGADTTVPLHLRNAPTAYMKREGYGSGYLYPHDSEGNYVEQEYFPAATTPRTYYRPGGFGKEQEFSERLKRYRPERYE